MCDKHYLPKTSRFVPVKVQIKTVMDGSSLVNILTAVHYILCHLMTVPVTWRKLHFEELHDLYVSSNIIRVMKSRKMRWAGHVSCLGEKRNALGILLGKPKKKGGYLEDLGMDGRVL